LMPPRPGCAGSDRAAPKTTAARGGAQLLVPLACAGVLALSFGAGAQLAAAQGTAPAGVDEASVSDVSDATAAEAETPDVGTGPPPSPAPPAGGADALPPPPAPTADPARYCQLSDQLDTLYNLHPDQPGVAVEQAAALLTEMAQAAPAQIRDAITVVVDDLRADAGVPGATAPGEAILTRAEESVDAFDEQNC
jgi:hypothetical protein